MTDTKKQASGVDLLQKQADEDAEKGYRGTSADPLPNSAHSLESGPDSPSPASQIVGALQQRAEQAASEIKEDK